jgi:hypothetical protein
VCEVLHFQVSLELIDSKSSCGLQGTHIHIYSSCQRLKVRNSLISVVPPHPPVQDRVCSGLPLPHPRPRRTRKAMMVTTSPFR